MSGLSQRMAARDAASGSWQRVVNIMKYCSPRAIRTRKRERMIRITTRAYKLIEHRLAWTRGTLAATGGGVPCSPVVREAVLFCLYGAVRRASFEELGYVRGRLMADAIWHYQIRHVTHGVEPMKINDKERNGHQAALLVLRRTKYLLAR